ncbi:MAG TPA: hypothetical protein VFC09_02645 [Candidatus Dormibacteraeota bacterium]|nr:hypothetical protein [Candidatus Dormibacteraeota bacterium]
MNRRAARVMLDHVVQNSEDRPMPTRPLSFPFSVRRIVACGTCGGRRRTLVDSAQGLHAHCMGCGTEVAFPFAVEDAGHAVGRAGQVVVHG